MKNNKGPKITFKTPHVDLQQKGLGEWYDPARAYIPCTSSNIIWTVEITLNLLHETGGRYSSIEMYILQLLCLSPIRQDF